jgi:uncharacterized YccA/Bax inhibitor family protein
MQTSNPAFRSDVFRNSRSMAYGQQGIMTVEGTVNKTGILLFLLLAAAAWVWTLAYRTTGYGEIALVTYPGIVTPWMMGGLFGGLICAVVLMFKQDWAPYLAPAYAVAEGLFLGGISATLELRYPGIPTQAAVLTFGVLGAMLFAYKANLIRPTERFRSGMMAAMGGLMIVYLGSMILGMFGVGIPFLFGSSPIGIGFSLIVVVLASLSLVLDFDFIAQGSRMGAPKYMEWYGAFSLMVTLVWLYMEILRLLMKLNDRRN